MTATNPHNMTKRELRIWAGGLCEQWNWNGGAMEIAKDFEAQGVRTGSREFGVLSEEFSRFFKAGKTPCLETAVNILEYNE